MWAPLASRGVGERESAAGTRNGSATADDEVAWVQDLCDALQVPPLESYGITSQDFAALVEKASVAGSMKGNPIELTPDEMEQILNRAP